MSRSKKKAVHKDHNKGMKRMANKALRAATREALHHEKEMPVMNDVINQYDVCDYRFFGEGFHKNKKIPK